jgi:chemotaxis protein CheZ
MADIPDTAAAALTDRLAAIRARYVASDPDMVADVVRAVLSTMSGDLTAKETSLLTEVESLGRTIAAAKAEIAALRVDDITVSDIPFATDELDAIVAHTAAATHAILETCETLDAVAEHLAGEPAAQLQDATTRIYEACGFQDITGQRITKVVNTLKIIETKVGQLVSTFGETGSEATTPGVQVEAILLNGPQLPTMAMDQSDIDKLLASFE